LRIRTKLTRRGKTSHITTVPRNLLFLRGIDVERDLVNVVWEIDLKTGKFIVDFEKIEEQKRKCL
jgi:hypothetical protein